MPSTERDMTTEKEQQKKNILRKEKQMTHTRQQRKTRKDKGVHQLTSRDCLMLTWIADQYAMRFDHVRELLSEHAEGQTKGELLAIPTVQSKINKWVHAGWAKYRRWLADGPGWVWVTKQGLAQIGQDDYRASPPSPTRLAHIYAVNAVRMQLDYDDWTSERGLRADADCGSSKPIPDAVITSHGKEIAIEVEISIKKPNDLVEKMERLLPYYTFVHFYVPDAEGFRAVERARDKLEGRRQRRVAVYQIDLSRMPRSLDD